MCAWFLRASLVLLLRFRASCSPDVAQHLRWSYPSPPPPKLPTGYIRSTKNYYDPLADLENGSENGSVYNTPVAKLNGLFEDISEEGEPFEFTLLSYLVVISL